jgi:hypothetical protein
MSDVRRKLVRLMILILPAILLIAAMYAFRGDLRDAAAKPRNPGWMHEKHKFDTRKRRDELGPWVSKFIAKLSDNGIYGFKEPASGFSIVVRGEQGATRYVPGSKELVVWGIRDEAAIQRELSRLITCAMLWEGAPDADFSPWFVEGVSRFYESTDVSAVGSRKEPLTKRAADHPPASLGAAKAARPESPNFDAVSHSLVAFIHEQYPAEKIALYAAVERAGGPVPPGAFESVFGPETEFEKAWRDDLLRR